MREHLRRAPGNPDPGPALRGLLGVVVSRRWNSEDRLFELVNPAAGLTPEQAMRDVTHTPDLYVVDVREGGQSALVERISQGGLQPVVVVGGDPGLDSVPYLDAGAADYIPLSTPSNELGARLRAATRRGGPRPRVWDEVTVGNISISIDRHEVRRGGTLVPLTPHEFQLLETLVATPDETVPHHKLMVRVWGVENATSRHYLRIYIRQLRKKLELDPETPAINITEWGRGYRFRTDAAVR
jgi:DNA-binding response OmpR family regulator